MKKYISPIARIIELDAETLVAASPVAAYSEQGGEEQSNERERFSIWGNEDLY